MTASYLRWLCPWCDHFLEFVSEDGEIAVLAMLSHIGRQHNICVPNPEGSTLSKDEAGLLVVEKERMDSEHATYVENNSSNYNRVRKNISKP